MKALIVAVTVTLASGSAWGQASCSDPDAHCRDAKTGREVHFLGTPMTPEMVAEQQAQQQAAHPGRAYTLDEIDRMRAAVFSLMTGGKNVCLMIFQTNGDQQCGDPSETDVTLRLLTYIAASISPEALEAKAKEGK